MVSAGGKVFDAGSSLGGDDRGAVLLVSHELSLTGAPIALFGLARALKGLGLRPTMLSYEDGPLREEVVAGGVPVVVLASDRAAELVACHAHAFALVVANTILAGEIASVLNGTDVPVLWWVHEASGYGWRRSWALPQELYANVAVATPGEWARRILHRVRPRYEIGELLYGVEDRLLYDAHGAAGSRSLTFALVGGMSWRKGQDVLMRAAASLGPEVACGCRFALVGEVADTRYAKEIRREATNLPNVKLLGQLSREAMLSFYDEVDCLVCASRDDPMPVVVAEACQRGKLVICSANTGSAALLEEYGAGLVYGDNDPERLADCIRQVCGSGSDVLEDMRHRARRLYEERFDERVFEKHVARLAEDMLSRDSVLDAAQEEAARANRERALRTIRRHYAIRKSVGYRVARACYLLARDLGLKVRCALAFRSGGRGQYGRA